MIVGSVVYANAGNCDGGGGAGTMMLCGPLRGQVTGMALLASGLIGVGLGLPLTLLGAAYVPRAEAGSVASRGLPRATVALGARGAVLTLPF